MVGRYNENGVPRDDGTLDTGEGGEVEDASWRNWVQGLIRHTQWREPRQVHGGTTGPCGDYERKEVKGMSELCYHVTDQILITSYSFTRLH